MFQHSVNNWYFFNYEKYITCLIFNRSKTFSVIQKSLFKQMLEQNTVHKLNTSWEIASYDIIHYTDVDVDVEYCMIKSIAIRDGPLDNRDVAGSFWKKRLPAMQNRKVCFRFLFCIMVGSLCILQALLFQYKRHTNLT